MENIDLSKKSLIFSIIDVLFWIILFIVFGIHGIKTYQQEGSLFELILVCVISIYNLVLGIRLLVKKIKARKTYIQ